MNYLLGDHLGSTSLTTDANGQTVSELRYKAWGETRYASGTTPTKYQYTGQYTYASDFGLLFYNARWYDSSLGRFAQADTIIPEQSQGVQAWDHYAYVNNPLRYTDPTGHHCDEDINGYCLNSTTTTPTPTNFWQNLWQTVQSWFTPINTTGPVVVAPQPAPQIPYWQYATTTPQPPTATPQLSGQVTAQTVATATATLTATSTPEIPQILYHYTSYEGLAGILASQTLLPSLGSGPNAFFGQGIYFTNITPAEAAVTSPYNLSLSFYRAVRHS